MERAGGRFLRPAMGLACVLCLIPLDGDGARYPCSDGIIGKVQHYRVRKNESLVEIARKFNLGYNSIVDANPGVDPFTPPEGGPVTIPTARILPDLPLREGIIINLPELRLYFFNRRHAGTVFTFPLGIGDEGRDTPAGSCRVVDKIINPAWHVPKSIRREKPGLPKVVPPGPDNPMGSHALRLSRRGILIHGTNKPWAIGRRSSHGCLRLYPEDILQLFALVPKGTMVTVVNQPIKVAVRGRKVFMEVHGGGGGHYKREALALLARKKLADKVDFSRMKLVLEEKRGIPVEISRRSEFRS